MKINRAGRARDLIRARVVAIACVLTSCREEVRELELVFGAGKGQSEGLACELPNGNALIERIWSDGPPRACMVVDLVPTEGSSGCRLTELLTWCTEHECAPDLDHRVLISLDEVLPKNPMNEPAMLIARLRAELDGTVIFDDAPEVLAMLRVSIIARPCEEIGDDARFSCADVVGCIYSCPISIGSFSGEVVLDLDSIDETTCLRDIRVCAGDHMFDRDEVMSPCDTDAFMP